jgi:hypothetical protein
MTPLGNAYNQSPLADTPSLFGTALQRRMWLKKHFNRLPFRYLLLFLYHWLWQVRGGRVGSVTPGHGCARA